MTVVFEVRSWLSSGLAPTTWRRWRRKDTRTVQGMCRTIFKKSLVRIVNSMGFNDIINLIFFIFRIVPSGFNNTESAESPFDFQSKKEGTFYFLCGVGAHCKEGLQKAEVQVKKKCSWTDWPVTDRFLLFLIWDWLCVRIVAQTIRLNVSWGGHLPD